jgi:Asp-tRNA(Asn)/Glu-tRNA(Gln) amidotransferase A subunit family amidase
MSEIDYLDATELATLIRTKQVSPLEVVRAHLSRIAEINPRLNAIVTINQEAEDQARAAERAVMERRSLGPLHGVPFTVKDCFDTAGIRTTRGSKFFSDHIPEADATAVARLKSAGGILLGKTNTPEFAFWWETGNLVFGTTVNPWNADRTTGGSSGGEAAAIAAGLSALGLGSDVGGSIRAPANYCGIVGLKPTHGRVPLTGHYPEVLLRFMHAGPMARTVRDVGLALSALAGGDGADGYALGMAPPDLSDLDSFRPLRVGYMAEEGFGPIDSEVVSTVSKAADALKSLGCSVDPVMISGLQMRDCNLLSATLFAAETRNYFEERTWRP